ncbi:MAG: NPCBM/NEW2 domain-containing protein [Intestinibacillus sp.]
MKKLEKTKYFALGAASALLFGTVVLPAGAALLNRTIQVQTGVSIYVDDVKLNPTDASGNAVTPFIYNGTTYLPVRAVGTAVGKAVQWDSKTSSVYLGKHESTEPAAWLKDLEDFNHYYTVFETKPSLKDNVGNLHSDALYLGSTTSTASWEEYLINGQYTSIRGSVCISYAQRSTFSSNALLRIYGDDKLLYTSPYITVGTQPIAFNVDLTGVTKLKVETVSADADHASPLYLTECGLYT